MFDSLRTLRVEGHDYEGCSRGLTAYRILGWEQLFRVSVDDGATIYNYPELRMLGLDLDNDEESCELEDANMTDQNLDGHASPKGEGDEAPPPPPPGLSGSGRGGGRGQAVRGRGGTGRGWAPQTAAAEDEVPPAKRHREGEAEEAMRDDDGHDDGVEDFEVGEGQGAPQPAADAMGDN